VGTGSPVGDKPVCQELSSRTALIEGTANSSSWELNLRFMRIGLNISMKRLISALIGSAVLVATLIESYLQSFGFYIDHFTIPIAKYGVRTPFRWEDIAFLAVFWPVALVFFYISFRLLKYAFSPPSGLFFKSAAIGLAASVVAGLLAFAFAPWFDAVGVYTAVPGLLIPIVGRGIPARWVYELLPDGVAAAGVLLILGCTVLCWTIIFGGCYFAWIALRGKRARPPVARSIS
jgi:hypothetical protein